VRRALVFLFIIGFAPPLLAQHAASKRDCSTLDGEVWLPVLIVAEGEEPKDVEKLVKRYVDIFVDVLVTGCDQDDPVRSAVAKRQPRWIESMINEKAVSGKRSSLPPAWMRVESDTVLLNAARNPETAQESAAWVREHLVGEKLTGEATVEIQAFGFQLRGETKLTEEAVGRVRLTQLRLANERFEAWLVGEKMKLTDSQQTNLRQRLRLIQEYLPPCKKGP